MILRNSVKSLQRSGTEATRTLLQPSKPKREITNFKKYEGCPESIETAPISLQVSISRKQNLYHIKEHIFLYIYAK